MENDYYNIKLSKVDELILESTKHILKGLSSFYGAGFEYVLHSLHDLERSVIAIENGFYSQRELGAPITDFALNMLSKIEDEPNTESYVYYNKTTKDKSIKSTTIPVIGEKKNVIGLVCINFYLDTPLIDIIQGFTNHTNTINVSENFVTSHEELLSVIVTNTINEIERNPDVARTNKNKEIVLALQEKGVFNMKNSVIYVANKLDISKNTVYMHIRNNKTDNSIIDSSD